MSDKRLKLPDPDHVKQTQAARAKQQELSKDYKSLADKEAELQEQFRAQDQGGASYETLQALELQLRQVERELELKERDLNAADQAALEARAQAEAKTKISAKEQGKEIAERILATLKDLEQAQEDYKSLTGGLRQLVNFKWNVESESTYCGPDPGPVFKAAAWPVVGYKEIADRFLQDWPELEQEPEAKPVQLPDQFIIS